MYIPHQMIGTTSISKNKELLQLPMVKSEEERRETRAASNWNKSSLTANGIGLSGRVSKGDPIRWDGKMGSRPIGEPSRTCKGAVRRWLRYGRRQKSFFLVYLYKWAVLGHLQGVWIKGYREWDMDRKIDEWPRLNEV